MNKETPTLPNNMSLVPVATAQIVKPKPSKSEIIEALVELQVEALTKQAKEASVRRDEINKVLREMVEKHVEGNIKKLIKTASISTYYSNGGRVTLEFPSTFSPVYAKLRQELDALPYIRVDRKEIRKEIKARIDRNPATRNTNRVATILADKESRAALTDLLKAISAPTEKQITQ